MTEAVLSDAAKAAYDANDFDKYYAALQGDSRYTAVLNVDGMQERLKADFEADHLRAMEAGGFSITNIMNNFDNIDVGQMWDKMWEGLQNVWDNVSSALTSGDWGQAIKGLLGLTNVFNMQADPERLAALDQKVTQGVDALDPTQRTTYDALIGANGPGAPTPGG